MADTDKTFRVGEKVRHRRFGVGTVTEAMGGRITIRFPDQDRVFVPEIAPLTKVDGEANSEFAA